jgi:mono/diheme cytochrome c family protein
MQSKSMVVNANAIVTSMVSIAASLGFLLNAAAADPENGERLAKRWCSACHVVAADQSRASADVPPFATIAQDPGFSSAKLALFLLDPHPKMPSMALTRHEAMDIADYISTFRHAQ